MKLASGCFMFFFHNLKASPLSFARLQMWQEQGLTFSAATLDLVTLDMFTLIYWSGRSILTFSPSSFFLRRNMSVRHIPLGKNECKLEYPGTNSLRTASSSLVITLLAFSPLRLLQTAQTFVLRISCVIAVNGISNLQLIISLDAKT